MKKIILGITAIIFSAGAYAQIDQKHHNTSDTTVYQTSDTRHPDGYMMDNGQMMCLKDHQMTILKNDTTLTNGTIVMRNGNFIRRGETKSMFKEGQHMDLNGKMVMMSSSSDRDKKMDGNKNKKMYLIKKDTTKIEKNQK